VCCTDVSLGFQSTTSSLNTVDVSYAWAVVNWEPLTTVVDRNGNIVGTVAGYFISWSLVCGGCFKTVCCFINPTFQAADLSVTETDYLSPDSASFNITLLQEETLYYISLSAFIGNVILGPPAVVNILTLSK